MILFYDNEISLFLVPSSENNFGQAFQIVFIFVIFRQFSVSLFLFENNSGEVRFHHEQKRNLISNLSISVSQLRVDVEEITNSINFCGMATREQFA